MHEQTIMWPHVPLSESWNPASNLQRLSGESFCFTGASRLVSGCTSRETHPWEKSLSLAVSAKRMSAWEEQLKWRRSDGVFIVPLRTGVCHLRRYVGVHTENRSPHFTTRSVKTAHVTDTYLTVSHHRKIGLETIWCSIYSIMRQSVLILLDWLLCSIPSSAGISEAVVSGVVLVLLRWGERVEVSLHVALGLSVELCLEWGQLLGHAEEAADFYAKNHPDYIYGGGRHTEVVSLNVSLPAFWPGSEYFVVVGQIKTLGSVELNVRCSLITNMNPRLISYLRRIIRWLYTSSTGPGTCLGRWDSASAHSHLIFPGGLVT